ncbi:MAG: hypothetical protein AAF718_05705 [Pseudomonadota bacterium]
MLGGNVLWFLVIGVLIVVPFWKLLPRYGISKYFAFLAVLPAIALVMLWIMAFKDDIEGGRT